MTCGSCGEHNRDGAKFCGECGASLARTCTHCSAELRPDTRFCDACGTAVRESPSGGGEPSADDGAVRKTVTIVFADVVGSTAFAEAVDPETARREMAAYHHLAQNVIERHGGTLVKFIGDGVMAVFGVPDVAEDDADRAVRAGLDLQRDFEAIAAGIDARHGLTVGLRVGVNSGEIVISDGDADMVGDAINTAARIEAQCTPGKVLVGEHTWRLTRSAVDYEVLGEVRVKGKGELVATFQVIATAEDEEVATPFVGRIEELATLTAALDDTVADGSPQLVTVIGSPGVGKTRLAAELAARAKRVSTFDLRVDRAGAATFEPIADLLRGVVDLPDGLDGDGVARRLNLFVGESDDRDRLVPLLASFVGVAPLRSTEESLWAARRLVEVITAERPAVIVIDDIQWAEPLFLDLLEHLVEWVDGPAFLVALARPEIREIRPAFAETGGRISEVVALEGLDAATTEALAAGILGTDRLPAGLADRLPDSTQGNPLFVRELVRMLVDDGTITQSADGWILSIDVDAVEVPPTIMSLLASRVERMDDDERRVIEMAGIVGSEFARGAVASLMPEMGGAQLDRIFERLRRKEVLDATGNYWGDEPLWRFHHVLIRDAAYRRLLKERRADLHRRVAEWTAAAAARLGGEHEITIAFHYEQAHEYLGELGPVDAAGAALGIRAAELLTTAAHRALDQDDLPAAGTLARRALGRLPAEDHRRAELLLIGCEAFFSAGRVHDGDPMLEELQTYGEADQRLAAWAEAFAGQHVVLTEPERLADAAPKVALAAGVLADLGDDAGVAKARLVRALILARQGRVGDAEEELDLALFAAREADDRRRITAVLGAAPLAALWGPSPVARAGGRCLDIIRLLRITSASPMVEATSIRCQAVLEAMRGRFDESRQLIARSAVTVEELGLRHGVLETAMYAGYIELLAGDPVAAEPHLRTAYAGLGSLGVGADAGQAAAHLARAIFAQGRIDEAAEIADHSDALAGQGLQALIASRAVRAEIAAARGDLDAAVQLATEAVDIAGLTDFTMDHADASRSLAVVLDVAGRSSEIAAVRAAATALYEAKGATPVATPSSESELAAPGELQNEATDLSRVFWHHMLENMDVGAAMESISPDCLLIDHRQLGTGELTRPQLAEFMVASLVGVEEVEWTHEIRAIRGDQLSLVRVAGTYQPSGFSRDVWVVSEAEAGLSARIDTYDPEDFEAALAQLEQRYLEGEGAAYANVLQLWTSVNRALARSAHDDAAALADLDGTFVDHRPGQRVELSLRQLKATTAEMAGTRYEPQIHHVDHHGVVFAEVAVLTDVDGFQAEWRTCQIQLFTEGRVTRWEVFEEHDNKQALARYAELAEPTERRTRPPLRNRASDVNHAATAAIYDARDLEAAMTLIADDLAVEDHRPLVGMALRKSDIAASFSEILMHDGDLLWTLEVLAIRGERLCLARFANARSGTGFETSTLVVVEINDEGLMTATLAFDPDDLDAAVEELERRSFTFEAAEFHKIGELAIEFRDRGNDPDSLRQLLTEGFAFVDHRTMGFPDTDADGFVDLLNSGLETVGLRQVLTRQVLALAGSGLLSEIHTTGDGVEWDFLAIVIRSRDRICRQEVFEADDVDHAFARFHELTAAPPETTASRFAAEMFAMFARGDSDAFGSRVLDEVQTSSHRPLSAAVPVPQDGESWVDLGFSMLEQFPASTQHAVTNRGDLLTISAVHFRSTSGFELLVYMPLEFAPDGTLQRTATFGDEQLDEAIEMLDSWWADSLASDATEHDLRNQASDVARRAVGDHAVDSSAELEVIAIRGQRSAVVRRTFSDDESGSGGEILEVLALDSGGHLIHQASFEPADLRLALDELNDLYLADEGAPFRDVVEVAWAVGKAAEGTDSEWAERGQALFSEDFEMIDHQPISMPVMDKDTFIAWPQGLQTHTQVIVSQYYRIATNAVLIHRVDHEKNDSGGTVTWETLTLLAIRDRQAILVELFPVDQLDAAIDRFDEVTAEADME